MADFAAPATTKSPAACRRQLALSLLLVLPQCGAVRLVSFAIAPLTSPGSPPFNCSGISTTAIENAAEACFANQCTAQATYIGFSSSTCLPSSSSSSAGSVLRGDSIALRGGVFETTASAAAGNGSAVAACLQATLESASCLRLLQPLIANLAAVRYLPETAAANTTTVAPATPPPVVVGAAPVTAARPTVAPARAPLAPPVAAPAAAVAPPPPRPAPTTAAPVRAPAPVPAAVVVPAATAKPAAASTAPRAVPPSAAPSHPPHPVAPPHLAAPIIAAVVDPLVVAAPAAPPAGPTVAPVAAAVVAPPTTNNVFARVSAAPVGPPDATALNAADAAPKDTSSGGAFRGAVYGLSAVTVVLLGFVAAGLRKRRRTTSATKSNAASAQPVDATSNRGSDTASDLDDDGESGRGNSSSRPPPPAPGGERRGPMVPPPTEAVEMAAAEPTLDRHFHASARGIVPLRTVSLPRHAAVDGASAERCRRSSRERTSRSVVEDSRRSRGGSTVPDHDELSSCSSFGLSNAGGDEESSMYESRGGEEDTTTAYDLDQAWDPDDNTIGTADMERAGSGEGSFYMSGASAVSSLSSVNYPGESRAVGADSVGGSSRQFVEWLQKSHLVPAAARTASRVAGGGGGGTERHNGPADPRDVRHGFDSSSV